MVHRHLADLNWAIVWIRKRRSKHIDCVRDRQAKDPSAVEGTESHDPIRGTNYIAGHIITDDSESRCTDRFILIRLPSGVSALSRAV